MSRLAIWALAIASATTAAYASAGPAQQTGAFALLGGKPQIVSKFWAAHGTGSALRLNVQQFPPNSTSPILNYDVDMQHSMHMVIVRDDFATFAHMHPAFNVTAGIFEQDFTKERNHKYYVYADSIPHGIGQQVFRFTLDSDGPSSAPKPSLTPSPYNEPAGPYHVLLQKTTIVANRPQRLDLSVVSGDDPATDLVPYLGTPAHVVMIETTTLTYVHVHPRLKGDKMPPKMNAMVTMTSSNQAGPLMRLDLPALPAGVYKTWVQFAAGKALRVYTATFTLVAQ